MHAKFVHTNLVAKDWRALAKFYEEVFGCERLPPERKLSGGWLADTTGVPDASLEGIHLRLPGYGEGGPTLEIFTYTHLAERLPATANRPGFAHIAFAVEDVRDCRDAVLAAGGHEVGQVVRVHIPGAGEISVIYIADPEGNLIELQRWSQV